MISICIPIYNFNVSALVEELGRQMKGVDVPVELILIDDCSTQFKEENKLVCAPYRYIQLENNIGRAKIRNLFLDYAQYDHLLFLDCDALIITKDFLANYCKVLANSPSLVCGGRVYPEKRPDSTRLLRWKYGVKKESQPVQVRRQHPNKSFMTNNFLVTKQLLKDVKFDENISQYGHEDTLFGYELGQRKVEITHIDNPILNGDIETNEVFFHKTKEGVKNLVTILQRKGNDKDFMKELQLLNYYNKVKPFEGLILIAFMLAEPFIHFVLTKGWVNLKLFDFYKLGLFIRYKRKLNQLSCL